MKTRGALAAATAFLLSLDAALVSMPKELA